MEKMRTIIFGPFRSHLHANFLLVFCIICVLSSPVLKVDASFTLNESALRRYLEQVLELENVTAPDSRSVTNGRPPHYVQELYDVLTDDDDDGRSRVPYKHGLFTVQAVCQDHRAEDEFTTPDSQDNDRTTLHFSLHKLWMKPSGVARAELVLELHRASLPPAHLHAGTSASGSGDVSYTLKVLAWPEATLLAARPLEPRRRRFAREFVVVDVTRAVRRSLLRQRVGQVVDGNHTRRRRQEERRSFDAQLVVVAKGEGSASQRQTAATVASSASTTTVTLPSTQHRRFDVQRTARLFHVTSKGQAQPLLVLYSSMADFGGNRAADHSSYVDRQRLRRRRRNRHVAAQFEELNDDDVDDVIARDEDVTADGNGEGAGRRRRLTDDPEGNADDPGNPPFDSSATCSLRSWPVDLDGLLLQRLMMPKKVDVNFCSGVCPFPVYDSHWNATNNAVIRSSFIFVRHGQQQSPQEQDVVSQRSSAVIPDALCVPRTYNPMSFLFSENNNYVFRKLDHVVATSCMCA